MTRMRAAEAAVAILEREGTTHAFGVPGAAINPTYPARARPNPAHPGAPRRGRRAHGRGLHPGPRSATSVCASALPARPART